MNFTKQLLLISFALLINLSKLQAERFNFPIRYQGKEIPALSLDVRYLLVDQDSIEKEFLESIDIEQFEGKELWIEWKNVKFNEQELAVKAKRTKLSIPIQEITAFPGLELLEIIENDKVVKRGKKIQRKGLEWKPAPGETLLLKYKIVAPEKGLLKTPVQVYISRNKVGEIALQIPYYFGNSRELEYWASLETTQDTLSFALEYLKRYPNGQYKTEAEWQVEKMLPMEVSVLVLGRDSFEIQIQNADRPYIDSIAGPNPQLLKNCSLGEALAPSFTVLLDKSKRGEVWLFLKDQWGKSSVIYLTNTFKATLDSLDHSPTYCLSIFGGKPPYMVEFYKAGTQKRVYREVGIFDTSVDLTTIIDQLNGYAAIDIVVKDDLKNYRVNAGTITLDNDFHLPYAFWLLLSLVILILLWRWLMKRYVTEPPTVFDLKV